MTLQNIFMVLCFSVFCLDRVVHAQTTVFRWHFGEIHGVTRHMPVDGNIYSSTMFRGVPYAQPPVGERRFKKPESIERLDSPFNATEERNHCIQFSYSYSYPGKQSEDCLFLNIYMPGEQQYNDSRYAVAVWIHGGSFLEGTGNIFDGSLIALIGNVIIVTINYRLGPYGFLSTEDDNAPGNNVFWDQHMAFQWVHDNIGAFGGDNKRVTIFGESAGGTSVIQQGFITQNTGLFQRIIAQSGSAFIPTFPNADKNALEDAQRLGEGLGCELWSTEVLMSCLRNKTNEDILNTMMTNGIRPENYEYVIDNILIKRDAKSLLSHKDTEQMDELEFYRSLDVINGYNSHEGILLYPLFNPIESQPSYILREEMKARISVALEFAFGIIVDDSVIEMVMAEYTNWSNLTSVVEVHLQLIKLYGDIVYGTPAIKTSTIHEQKPSSSRTYLYYLVANTTVRPLPTPEWIPGANHADDLYFVFGIEAFMNGSDPKTTWEIQLSRKMIRYWTNFMKSGNPNVPEAVSPMWPEYDNEYQHYLKLEENTTDESVGQFLYARETNFWYNVFPAINEALDRKPTDCNKYASSASFVSPKLRVLGVFIAFILSI